MLDGQWTAIFILIIIFFKHKLLQNDHNHKSNILVTKTSTLLYLYQNGFKIDMVANIPVTIGDRRLEFQNHNKPYPLSVKMSN